MAEGSWSAAEGLWVRLQQLTARDFIKKRLKVKGNRGEYETSIQQAQGAALITQSRGDYVSAEASTDRHIPYKDLYSWRP